VLVIEPFAREKEQMRDTRWMAILDGRVLAFGNPVMVKTAIGRYQAKRQPDEELARRVAELHGGVGSWNILQMPQEMMVKHVEPTMQNALWVHLLAHANALTFGVHSGERTRIYLDVETGSVQEANATAAMLQPEQLLRVGLTRKCGMRVEDVKVEGSWVQAEISDSGKDKCGLLGR
jgi:hypothetical protein